MKQCRASEPKYNKQSLKGIGFWWLGTPEEGANWALFLASDAASWGTGKTIAVDGGQRLG